MQYLWITFFNSTVLACTCGPFECSCRWRAEHPEAYAPTTWSPAEPQGYAYAAVPPATSLPPQQHYDPNSIPADEIFHPEEIFQLDQPIRLDFPIEESTLESPPTFADLNENSRPEDSYWLEWQRAAGGSESSEAPSPELFGNGYQQAEAYCEQQTYPQAYYPEEGQYYPAESTRTSPIMDMQEQRYYRYGQDCVQSGNVDMQTWNYTDCAFTSTDVPECKQYFDIQHQQAVNAFSALL